VSSVTERGRVYSWLDANDESDRPSTISQTTVTDSSSDLLPTSKLSQTIGYLSLHVADKLRDELRLHEAYNTYRYALEMFEHHPPGGYNVSTLLSLYSICLKYWSVLRGKDRQILKYHYH